MLFLPNLLHNENLTKEREMNICKSAKVLNCPNDIKRNVLKNGLYYIDFRFLENMLKE